MSSSKSSINVNARCRLPCQSGQLIRSKDFSNSAPLAYSYAAIYPLKADAPDDAVDMLAKNMLVPLLEKLLADGTIVEYEIDEQAVHSDAPGMFVIDYLAPTAEGLDKVKPQYARPSRARRSMARPLARWWITRSTATP